MIVCNKPTIMYAPRDEIPSDFKNSVDVKFYDFITNQANLSEDLQVYNLSVVKKYRSYPDLKPRARIVFPYHPSTNSYRLDISLFGANRYAYIENPLIVDTNYSVARIHIVTKPENVMSTTARYEYELTGLKQEDKDAITAYLKNIQSEREIHDVINVSNTFRMPFYTNYTRRVKIEQATKA
jgi:hypothetical protein